MPKFDKEQKISNKNKTSPFNFFVACADIGLPSGPANTCMRLTQYSVHVYMASLLLTMRQTSFDRAEVSQSSAQGPTFMCCAICLNDMSEHVQPEIANQLTFGIDIHCCQIIAK